MALMKAAVIVTLMAFAIDAARLEASDGLEISMLQEELSRRSSLILELRHKEIQHLGEALKANASKMEKWGGGFGNGFDFSGWMAPAAPCASSQNTWQVAMCLYQMSGGNLQNIFYQLAGMDGKIDVSEWASRVAPTNAAKRIFITVASQEAPGRSFGGGDDPNTIDFDDWMRFVQAAQQAAGASMDVNEWSDYVAASVTAEALFDAPMVMQDKLAFSWVTGSTPWSGAWLSTKSVAWTVELHCWSFPELWACTQLTCTRYSSLSKTSATAYAIAPGVLGSRMLRMR